MPTLTELTWIFLLGFAGWYWWKAREIKEIALGAARSHCQKMDVMLLDQAVFLRGLWFKRDSRGRLRVWRRFHFEFATTGQYRYIGRVILLGRRVEAIQLDAHQIGEN